MQLRKYCVLGLETWLKMLTALSTSRIWLPIKRFPKCDDFFKFITKVKAATISSSLGIWKQVKEWNSRRIKASNFLSSSNTYRTPSTTRPSKRKHHVLANRCNSTTWWRHHDDVLINSSIPVPSLESLWTLQVSCIASDIIGNGGVEFKKNPE